VMRTSQIDPSGLRESPNGPEPQRRHAPAAQVNPWNHHPAPATGLGDRFFRRVWPKFQRLPRAVGEVLPQFYRHRLTLGDCDQVLRCLEAMRLPSSPASLTRLKAHWPREYEACKPRRLEDFAVLSGGMACMYKLGAKTLKPRF
jgi:hypothetical protein